jgi:hypothetical protein
MSAMKSFLMHQSELLRTLLGELPQFAITDESHQHATISCPSKFHARDLQSTLHKSGFAVSGRKQSNGTYSVRAKYQQPDQLTLA